MLIEKVTVRNFRNINKEEFEPGEKINILLGNNAQGKTNFIESIYFASLLKSFRTNKSRELIKYGSDNSYIELIVDNNKVKNRIKLYFDNDKKILKLNDKIPDKNNLFSYLNVIAFHPDEVNYLNSYPLFRRNLIDRSIFYTDYNYIDIYKNYYRCLRQRNNFLKLKSKTDDYWQEQLVKLGSIIIRKRLFYIEKINNYFSSDFFHSANKEEYKLVYSKNFSERENIEDELSAEFQRKQVREQELGYTLVGPHKDDVNFFLNGRSASQFASQGQKRSLVISFKTAQILDYQAVHGFSPVLILDDMTSELDSDRKTMLLENLLDNSGQVFITSTDFKQINCSEQTRVFRVHQGEISPAD